MSVINNHEVSDEVLCQELYAGNQQAFTTLYNRYWQVLFLHAYKMLENKDEAMDVVQEVFSTLWNNAQRIQIKGQAKIYLYVAVKHAVLKLIARGKLHDKFISYAEIINHSASQCGERVLLYKEFQEQIESAIDSLPPRMKEIFLLSRMEGLSHKEIAALLQLTETTVKMTVSRSLKLLRKKLPQLSLIVLYYYLKD